MNIGVIGSRDFQDYDELKNYIFKRVKLQDIDHVVSGGAIGADRLGGRLAKEFNIPPMIFKPDWDLYGKKAGFIRNKDIIENSDIIFAFWDGKSKGTKHSLDIAKNENKKIYLYEYTVQIEEKDEVFNDVLDYFLD